MKRTLMLLTTMMLLATATFANTVSFSWDRNTETDVTGYNLYRTTVAGSYNASNKVNTVLIPQTAVGTKPTFIDTTAPNSVVFYVIRAVNQAGLESGNSQELTANPLPPKPPTGFGITGITTASLMINGKAVASADIGDPLKYKLVVPKITPPQAREYEISLGYGQ